MSALPRRGPNDELLRRLGRNLILYQHLERALKLLRLHGPISAPVEKLDAELNRRVSEIRTRSMGQLAGTFVDDFLIDATSESEPAQLVPNSVGTVKIRAYLPLDPTEYEQVKAALTRVVKDRNDLTHHFLARFHPFTDDNMRRAQALLDEQHDGAEALLVQFEHFGASVTASRALMAAVVNSDEYEQINEFLLLQQSQLMQHLCLISRESTRPDGWCLLSYAERRLRRELPGELDDISERFGHTSLELAMNASELFDVRKEQTAGGMPRVMFRNRSTSAGHSATVS